MNEGFPSEPTCAHSNGDTAAEAEIEINSPPLFFVLFFIFIFFEMGFGRWGFHGAGSFQRNWSSICELSFLFSSFHFSYNINTTY
jgi:hypothetical protein